MARYIVVLATCLTFLCATTSASENTVRVKELARIEGVRDNALVGYGLVSGLAGSGDSPQNRATLQSVVNTLANFGVHVAESDLNARNAAAVMVTATLPPFAEAGDHLDVNVSSIGDARSLVGGTLLLTPLYGPDQRMYGLAQGPMSVGGYLIEANQSSYQKNHPTVGLIPHGATVEHAIPLIQSAQRSINVILNQPDFTTADHIAVAIGAALNNAGVKAIHAGKVEVPLDDIPYSVTLISRIENVEVVPDQVARIVINERTGTVVSGGNAKIGEVSISQGDLEIMVSTRFQVSQPFYIGAAGASVSTAIVPESQIKVKEIDHKGVRLSEGTSVSELVHALQRIKLGTRDIITILQAIKNAGALHAELIIQ